MAPELGCPRTGPAFASRIVNSSMLAPLAKLSKPNQAPRDKTIVKSVKGVKFTL